MLGLDTEMDYRKIRIELLRYRFHIAAAEQPNSLSRADSDGLFVEVLATLLEARSSLHCFQQLLASVAMQNLLQGSSAVGIRYHALCGSRIPS